MMQILEKGLILDCCILSLPYKLVLGPRNEHKNEKNRYFSVKTDEASFQYNFIIWVCENQFWGQKGCQTTGTLARWALNEHYAKNCIILHIFV